jgi:hypothetical protein
MKKIIVVIAIALSVVPATAGHKKKKTQTQTCEAWAAAAEKAEYFLNPKTGKIEWRWKQQTTAYSGSLYLNTQ